MNTSIIQYFGSQDGKCGYCAGTKGSKSHGMHAYRLDCQDYQDLIDRGWRRCGNYCYKLQNQETCCPCYTIKCNALEFKMSRSHKRVLRRMSRFLRDGRRENNSGSGSGDGDEAAAGVEVTASEPQPQLPDKSPAVINVEQVVSMAQAQKKPPKAAAAPASSKAATAAPLTLGINKCIPFFALLAADPISNAPRKKAKQMRLERRQAKLGGSSTPSLKSVSQEKSLRDFIDSASPSDKHQLKIVLVASSNKDRTCTDAVLALYSKYQIVVHNDNPARLTLASMQRFLVKSPLENDRPSDGPEMGYGSFHQQYWLDDKLIAVGVLDILPGSVSSVYFFYDPEYSFLSLGTYGSLREIDFVQTMAESVPALKYYYMGFYIHSCPKMRYKGKLSASYLLCPETYVWMLLTDDIRSRLDENKYLRLNPDIAARDVNEFLEEHLYEVSLLLDAKTFTTYRSYLQLVGFDKERDTIIEYSRLVGKECAWRMLYVNIS
ncbi:hypothetical protein KR018_003903 [Drosophila ironensis]|nr:hypothetical protein KR018_003903 [Drosophila ironensis]